MQKIKEYFKTPATWVMIITFVFWLWGVYATTNNRLTALEDKCHEVDIVKSQMYEIQTSLAQIQTDIQWVKMALQNK